MRKAWLQKIVRELLIQLLTLGLVGVMVVYLFPPELLNDNLWGSKDLGRPLIKEYVIACMVACNMIRLCLLALSLCFSKEVRQEQSPLTYIYSHH